MIRRNSISTSDIRINNFIFHIVHHGEEEPTLNDSTPMGRFNEFFKERILEIYNGNNFYFIENSSFKTLLEEIERTPFNFHPKSKELAQIFHRDNDGDKRIKAGVMIFMSVMIEDRSKYIIMKYDNENVLTYKKRGTDVILEEISNTFSRNKKALQKSAIIDFGYEEPVITVVDKSSRKSITDFFKKFLGVKRLYTERQLTTKLQTAFLSTVKIIRDQLPSDVTFKSSDKFYEVIRNNNTFDPDTFLQNALGTWYQQEFKQVFENQLKKNEILGESFDYFRELPSRGRKKYSTEEGVTIEFPDDADTLVDITRSNSDEFNTIITIKTKKLIEENVSNKTTNQ